MTGGLIVDRTESGVGNSDNLFETGLIDILKTDKK